MSKMSVVGVLIFGVLGLLIPAHADLKMGFYSDSCPKAEAIIQAYVEQHVTKVPTVAAQLLRMQFHDCFVRGCDGSVLINSTSSNSAEKDAIPNQTLRGFDLIDRLKSLIEAECAGVVSCADVLALAARDAVVTAGGPSWRVTTGRRDGTVSNETEALNDIPAPSDNFSVLQTNFADKGLDVKDLVILSGGHTIGVAHCPAFTRRLYNFTGVGDEDPALDSEYAANLRSNKCKTQTDNTTIVEMDPGSFRTFDLSYYRLLQKRRGLFVSDASLTTDSTSRSYVNELVSGPLSKFYEEFATSMEKMIEVGVKTGSTGEIRKNCAVINS